MGTLCPGRRSTHRTYTRSPPLTTRPSLPDVSRLTRRSTSKWRGQRHHSTLWCDLLWRAECTDWRLGGGKTKLHRGNDPGRPRPLAPSETPEKREGEIQTDAAMGEAITGTKTESREQREATLEMTTPVENNRPTCDMRPMQTERERLRWSGTR